MQKNSAFLWRPFVQRKTKESFVALSFISHIITVISYCYFVSASNWGAEQGWCEFVLTWHQFETRSADFFFFFFNLFLYLFQKPRHLFKENMQSKLLKVIASRQNLPSKDLLIKKVSSILQKMKIGQNSIYIRPFCTKPFNYCDVHLYHCYVEHISVG